MYVFAADLGMSRLDNGMFVRRGPCNSMLWACSEPVFMAKRTKRQPRA